MKQVRSVDFHCDVLWKLLEDETLSFEHEPSGRLDVTLSRLREAGAGLQTFAIFISSTKSTNMAPILKSIDLFYEKVLACPDMMHIQTKEDLENAEQSGRIGALLSLEGADGLQGDMAMLRILYRLGVRACGLTWNNANWGADGATEPRAGGLTRKGLEFVQECNRLGILLDVSHLSEKSFWDMADATTQPLIASHSNVKALCDHPRNLNDDQIRALIAMDGRIGFTYVPQFIVRDGNASVSDCVKHIEHMCELGGESHIMLGSDFDGIDSHVNGLAHPGELYRFREALHKLYKEETVSGFLRDNAFTFLRKHLPAAN
ncbi:dipeptidase [Paenibacillus xanthanilyticus]|uniref:Dipeptidase n=1 Tax=Paenibacillus xanthanilyticus TaxID=1783531 RepID=A0ABV8KBR6_9BACL